MIPCGEVGWLVVSTPLKNMKVSWDDDIPNIYGKIKNVPVTTNQLKAMFQTINVYRSRLSPSVSMELWSCPKRRSSSVASIIANGSDGDVSGADMGEGAAASAMAVDGGDDNYGLWMFLETIGKP